MARKAASRRAGPRRAGTRRPDAPRRGPNVILDFVFDRGLLFIAIRNIGDEPAYGVRVDFGAPLFGLGGTKEVSAQPLFRELEFLPPQKEIVTFLDTSASFFGSGQSTRIAARITTRDAAGARHVATIRHNLEIYRDIDYVDPPACAPAPLDQNPGLATSGSTE
jgi:hypothetical protein